MSDQQQLSRAALTFLCAVPRHDASRARPTGTGHQRHRTKQEHSQEIGSGETLHACSSAVIPGRRSRARNPDGELCPERSPGFRPALRATGMTGIARRCSCASPSLQGRVAGAQRRSGGVFAARRALGSTWQDTLRLAPLAAIHLHRAGCASRNTPPVTLRVPPSPEGREGPSLPL